MKQIQMFLLSAMLFPTVAASCQQVTSGANSPADIIYAQSGHLVDVGGFRLNLYCIGSGSPTVTALTPKVLCAQ
jgi:hypothetical protein